jgi:hypothetical protein
MERSPAWAVLLAGALIAGGCGRSDRAAIERRLQQKPVTAVMEEVSRAEYQPPADGRLTAPQVEMYLEVRERGGRIREVAASQPAAARPAAAARSGAGDAGDAATADLRAAQELHRNPKEYLWVKVRVLEAQTAEVTRSLLHKMELGRGQLMSRLRQERDLLIDPAAKAAAERRLVELERGLQESEPAVPRNVEANVRLLIPYRERLARLQQLEERALMRSASGLGPNGPPGSPGSPGSNGPAGSESVETAAAAGGAAGKAGAQ